MRIIKGANIILFKDIKETLINEKRKNLSREIETIKKNQMEILKLKRIICKLKNSIGWA